MLKIKDATGKTIGTLKDEDSEPEMECKCDGKCACKEGCKCKCKKALDELVEVTEEMGLYDKEETK